MPVPSSITDLKTTPSANSPQGTESAKGTIDDYLRTHAAFLAQLNALVGGVTITLASGASVAIGAAQSLNVSITGTSTITSFDNVGEGALRWVTFAGALTLTHNAASMVLPGAANITTSAGDAAIFKSLGGGNWKCLSYTRFGGEGIIQASTGRNGFLSAADWNTFNAKLSTATAAATYLPKSGGTLSGPVIFADGSQGAPSITFSESGTDTGFFHIGDGQIGIVCNNVLVAKFTQTGFEAIKVSQTQ